MSLLNGRYRRDGPPKDGRMPAVHLATGRPVEIQRATGSTAELMRLKRALRDHADVMHPGWVLPIDAGLDDKGLYVVYPNPGGESLDALMGRPIPVSEVVDFLRQMGQMLGELHIRGQHHGLLRPDCIRRVRAVDGTTHYRVVDVGLINTAFAVFDTDWAAPESTVDAQGDIYALGRLAVSLLGGRVSAGQQMVPGDAPVGLTRMLMAMLSSERAQRPLSGTALLQALNASGRPKVSPPPLRPSREPAPELATIPGLSEMSSESTFERNLEVMTNQWRPLRRVALIVLVGGAAMFYVILGIPRGPVDVPHPSATTSRPDAGLHGRSAVPLQFDQGSPPVMSDAAVIPLDVPDLAVVFSPAHPVDAAAPSPDQGPEPAIPAVEAAAPPVPPKAKKPRRKRRRVKAKKPRKRRGRKRRAAKSKVSAPDSSDSYQRL